MAESVASGVNSVGTFRRTQLDETEDAESTRRNMLAQSWKQWPNEAAFEKLEEHRGPIPLKVTGNIPAWAAGLLYRTGPGQCRLDDTSKGTFYVSHWFDGFAHTHCFDIAAPSDPDGKTTVTYSSRRQSEDFVKRVTKKGWRSGVSFGQRSDPCVGIFSKMMSVFEPKLVTYNVTVQANVPGLPKDKPTKSGHRTGPENLYIATDVASMQRIDPWSLAPIGPVTQAAFHPDLSGPVSCAHAQRDPENGDLFNYNVEFGRFPTYRVFRVSAASGKTEILATFTAPPAYIHSFFLSQNYVVLCVPSSHYQWNGLGVMWHRNVIEAIEPFHESRFCRWFVIDRRHGGGVVARFSTPAGFFFHSVNAFEELVEDEQGKKRTSLVLDYIGYDNHDIINGFYYDVILDRNDGAKKYWLESGRFKTAKAQLVRQRFTLPRSATTKDDFSAKAERVLTIPGPHAGDLPTINPSYSCRKYRFVYGLPNRGLNTIVDAISKTDADTREATIWSGPRGHLPSEPIFVARPGGTEEDDGVLLSVVIDCLSETAYLLCLDARTMVELGRAEADFAIAMGFHGVHVA